LDIANNNLRHIDDDTNVPYRDVADQEDLFSSGTRGAAVYGEPAPIVDEYVLLKGHPTLREFIRFHRVMSEEGQRADEAHLAQEWRRAHQEIQAHGARDRGCTDAVVGGLPADMAPLAEAALEDPVVRKSLCHVPCAWKMVELDRLIVYQRHVNLAVVDELRECLPRSPKNEDLIRFAIGSARRGSDARVTQVSENVFSFSVGPVDLRVLDIVALDSTQMPAYTAMGHALGMIGVFVGFPVNFLSAVGFENRLILSNGSHRAYLLRQLGFTHAPCLVRQAACEEEVEFLASAEVKQNIRLYTKSPRPPLFRDYLDAAISKIVRVPRFHRNLQVQINTQHMRTQRVD
jgi:hypothetical protein